MSSDEFDDDLLDDDLLDDDLAAEMNGDEPRENGHETASETDTTVEEADDSGAGQRIGGGLGKALGGVVLFVTSMASTFVYTLTKFLPFIGQKFWKSAIQSSIRRYQKSAGADVVAFVHREGGKLEPAAAKWQDGDDIGDKPGWKVVGEETVWDPGAEGRGVERLGKADVILADEASFEIADPLKMRVSEALDLEKVEPLLVNPTLQQTVVTPGGDGSSAQAIADGGVQQGSLTVDPMDMAAFDDFAIDLAPDNPDADGMRISARKYKEMDLNKTGSEEMKNQETRGLLAGRAGTDRKSFILKVVLAAFGFVLLWEFGPSILAAIFGSDSISNAASSAGGNLMTVLPALGVI
jgi:hypothetical protein